MKFSKIPIMILMVVVVLVMLIACTDTNNNDNIYYIRFDLNGGEGDFPNVATTGNQTFAMPTRIPEREGYTFGGWFFDYGKWQNQLTTHALIENPIYDTTTVYAQWIFKMPGDGGEGGIENPTTSFVLTVVSEWHAIKTINVTDEITQQQLESQFEKDGYVLTGWYLNPQLSGSSITFPFDNGGQATNVTIYAKWVQITYPVYYSLGSQDAVGSPPPTDNQPLNGNFVLPDLTTNEAYLINHQFVGWKNNADAASEVLQPGSTYKFTTVPLGGSITFVAVWERLYSATFKSEMSGTTGVVAPIYKMTGEFFNLPNVDTAGYSLTGYQLVGWKDTSTGSEYAPTSENIIEIQMIQNGFTYEAIWKILYTVTYNVEATGFIGSVPSFSCVAGTEFKLPKPNFDGDAYVFKGWSYSSSYYVDGDTFKMPEGNITFTGTLDQVVLYTVKFEAEGVNELNVPHVDPMRANAEFTIPTNGINFERNYYEFSVWTYEINGVARNAFPGSKIVMPEENLTFTAVWIPLVYNITYEYETSVVSAIENNNPVSYTIKTENVEIKAEYISAIGYQFEGLYDDAARTSKITMPITIDATSPKDIVYYAKFVANKYKVRLSDGETEDDQYIQVADFIKTDTGGKYFEVEFGTRISDLLAQVQVQRESYILAYWAMGEEAYTAPTTWTNDGDIDLVAVWTQPGSEGLIFIPGSDGKHMRVSGYIGEASEVIIPSYQNRLPVISIDTDAFKGNQYVKKVTISSVVTTIESGAFAESALTELILGSGIISIGRGAFKDATSLRYVFADDNVKLSSIGAEAFYGCESLEYVYLPASLISVGEKAFADVNEHATAYMCGSGLQTGFGSNWAGNMRVIWNVRFDSDFIYVLNAEGGIRIVGYIGSANDVSVPVQLNNCNVVEIAPLAFSNNNTIRDIEVEAALDVVGNGAFENCTALRKVVFSKTPKTMAASAFNKSGSAVVYYLEDAAFIFEEKGVVQYKSIGAVENLTLDNATSMYYLNIGTESSPSYVITKYIGSSNSISVPALYNNKSVVGIGDGAFIGSNIGEISISTTIEIGSTLFYSTKKNVVIKIQTPIVFSDWVEDWNGTGNEHTVKIEFPTGSGWSHVMDNTTALEYYYKEDGGTKHTYVTDYFGSDTTYEIKKDKIDGHTIRAVIASFNNKSLQYAFVGADVTVLNSFAGNNELVVFCQDDETLNRLQSKCIVVKGDASDSPTKTESDGVSYYVYNSTLIRAITNNSIITVPVNLGINKIGKGALVYSQPVRITLAPTSAVALDSEIRVETESLLYYNGNVSNVSGANAYNSSNIGSTVDGFKYITENGKVIVIDYESTAGIITVPDAIDDKIVTKINPLAFRFVGNVTLLNVPFTVYQVAANALQDNANIGVYSLYITWDAENTLTEREMTKTQTTSFTYIVIDEKAYIIGVNTTSAALNSGVMTIPKTIGGVTVAGVIDPFAAKAASGKIKVLNIEMESGYIIGVLNSLADDATVILAKSESAYLLEGNYKVVKLYSGFTAANVTIDSMSFDGYQNETQEFIIASNLVAGSSDLAGMITIPDSIVAILPGVFKNVNLKTVKIDSKTHIAVGAFDGAYEGLKVILQRGSTDDDKKALLNRIFYENATTSNLFTIGNLIYYKMDDKRVVVVSYSNVAAQLGIPLSVEKDGVKYSVTEIGSYAFDGYIYNDEVAVREITIPDVIEKIGINAFINADSRIELRLHGTAGNWTTGWNNGLTYIEKYWVSTDTNFKYYVMQDKIYLTEYVGTSTVVEIPASIGSYEIVSIGTIFAGNKTIKELTIKASITEFANAIKGCVALTSIVLPASVTNIPAYGLANLSALATITFNATQITIGDYAFANLVKLTGITLPNITQLGEYVFSGCRSLASVDLSKFPNKTIPDGTFYECTNLDLDLSGIENIGSYAFYKNAKIKTINTNFITVGEYAFAACTGLITVVWSNSINVVPQGVFAETHMLRSVLLPSSVTAVSAEAFKNAVNLSIVTDSNNFANLKSVGDSAFEGCSTLVLDYPTAVEFVGTKAFYAVRYIGEVSLTQLKAIGIAAFAYAGVTAFADSTVYYQAENGVLYAGSILLQYPCLKTDVEKFEISNLIAVAPYALAGVSLNLITITNTPAIGEHAFILDKNAKILTEYNVKPSGWSDTWFNGVNGTVIWDANQTICEGEYIYEYDLKTESYLIKDYFGTSVVPVVPQEINSKPVSAILSGAFANKGITYIEIPSTIENIGAQAFTGNAGLVVWCKGIATGFELNWDQDITSYIGETALSSLDGTNYQLITRNDGQGTILVKVLTDDIKVAQYCKGSDYVGIDAYAFAGSSTIALVISDSVKYIDQNAFAGLYYPAVLTNASSPLDGWATGFDSNIVIYYSVDLNNYEIDNNSFLITLSTQGIRTLYKYVGDESDLIEIDITATESALVGAYAFAGVKIKAITIKSSTQIMQYAFANVNGLEEFEYILNDPTTDSVQIESYAFSGCQWLKTFKIMNANKDVYCFDKATIKAFAFDGCISLVKIDNISATTGWDLYWNRIKMQTASLAVEVLS
ncbi:MAG: leucine-rich repeat protein [Christensenellaceae bacterium]|nr:leucine-rich repeat protein [Christensenellaceae bacterium]